MAKDRSATSQVKKGKSGVSGLGKKGRVLAIAVGVGLLLLLVGVSGGTAYAIHLENQDLFCASCHTEPEVTYYDQSQASTPVTLAAFHAQAGEGGGSLARCIDCHSGGGPLGRVEGLTQGAQDTFSFMSGHYHDPAITTNPPGDDSCLKCHNQVTTGKASMDNHFHVFLARWQRADANAAHCIDCHSSHTTGTAGEAFTTRSVVTTECNACHRVMGD